MPSRFTPQYVDKLLAELAYDDLVQISSIICSSEKFDPAVADYRLPQFAFLYVETLVWFAQACRSGVWTYFEATPSDRQDAMLAALQKTGPDEFSPWYQRGMWSWRHKTASEIIDGWMKTNDERAHEWLRAMIRSNRDGVLELA